jgi:molybdopterin-synthase adenylyltransferase
LHTLHCIKKTILSMTDSPDQLARYHRQMLLAGIGEAGQRRLGECTALLVGCGALGTVIADALTRAGVGRLLIVDRDIVELTNLQRQVLFDERDVQEHTPKAMAAKARLERINRQVRIDAHVDDFNAGHAGKFAEGADILLDGLDNFETRYLLNDLAVSHGLPYVYGGAVGTVGMSMTVLPHPQHRRTNRPLRITWELDQSTPCLRCVFPDAPPPGTAATCDTAGVLGPMVSMVAAHQASEAIKLMTGNISAINRSLLSIDLWANRVQQFDVGRSRSEACPCCGQGRFDMLEGGAGGLATSLCGRGAVQINPTRAARAAVRGDQTHNGSIDLAALADRLRPHGSFQVGEHLLRGTLAAERGTSDLPIELLIFPTGRAIIKGTDSPERARSIYAKYIGA